jgi:putative NADPH-quinone reductase
MKVLVIIGHQQTGSFCHAIVSTAMETLKAAGHEVIYHDLYEERFDPILPPAEVPRDAKLDPVIQRHCDELVAADGYVIVHPNWWGQPPAMLKGWLDRVVRQGIAYKFGPQGVIQLLAGRRAMVFTTSNTPRDVELSVFHDPLENLWKTVIFGMVGVKQFERRNFEPVVLSTPEQRQEWLEDVRQRVAKFFGKLKAES